MALPKNSLERTQPQREFMYDVAMLRRSARSRYAAVLVSIRWLCALKEHELSFSNWLLFILCLQWERELKQ